MVRRLLRWSFQFAVLSIFRHRTLGAVASVGLTCDFLFDRLLMSVFPNSSGRSVELPRGGQYQSLGSHFLSQPCPQLHMEGAFHNMDMIRSKSLCKFSYHSDMRSEGAPIPHQDKLQVPSGGFTAKESVSLSLPSRYFLLF